MNKSLLIQALIKLVSGLLLICILIFLPAGSFSFWQGWLFIGILFIPMLIAGVILMRKKP